MLQMIPEAAFFSFFHERRVGAFAHSSCQLYYLRHSSTLCGKKQGVFGVFLKKSQISVRSERGWHQEAGRFPLSQGIFGEEPLIAAKHRTAAGRRSVPRPDDGVPHDTLKSPYLWYGDFSAVQCFAAISGSSPLAPNR